jgi:hypothetical protein
MNKQVKINTNPPFSESVRKKVFFLFCEKCGKKMLGRLPNGVFYFIFGKKRRRDGSLGEFSPVEIYIQGSLKMRCIDQECGHFNTFNYFPSEEGPFVGFKQSTKQG